MQNNYNEAFNAGRRSAIEDLFKLLPVEGEHFYFNQSNDYGTITFKWFCGEGNPWALYRGTEQQGNYANKPSPRGTGRYFLNDDAVTTMLAMLAEQVPR